MITVINSRAAASTDTPPLTHILENFFWNWLLNYNADTTQRLSQWSINVLLVTVIAQSDSL